MTITYKDSKYLGVRVPMLHKVTYAKTVDNVQAMFQRSYKDALVDTWLNENCQHPYYHSPGYLYEKFIEFEDDEEAFMFALKFGNGN